MDTLDSKYRNDTLTNEELAILREKINSASDTELEQLLWKAWFERKQDQLVVDTVRMDRIKKNLDQMLEKRKKWLPRGYVGGNGLQRYCYPYVYYGQPFFIINIAEWRWRL